MKSFYVASTQSVNELVNSGDWDRNYSHDKAQESDDGLLIYAVGKIPEGTIKAFGSVPLMLEWCYLNGWTKPEEEI